MYGNNIVNFQESTTILNAYTKIVWKLIEGTTYLCVLGYLRQRSTVHGGYQFLDYAIIRPSLSVCVCVCERERERERETDRQTDRKTDR